MTENGVTQTLLAGRDDGIPGNCVQAAVATYLRLPLGAVPHFLLFDDWVGALRLWLAGRGLEWFCHNPPVPTERSIVAGVSPRGISHVCVAEDCEIVFDPHPSRDGLVSVDEVWFFRTTGGVGVSPK